MLTCFVDEFNRLLADAILEALMADQGTSPAERRRRGSRRAFEPPPPLFLPAPQLLEGIVQICHGAAELLHTHFCCTQWHASAFDERLEDDAFLHTAATNTNTANTNTNINANNNTNVNINTNPNATTDANTNAAESSPAGPVAMKEPAAASTAVGDLAKSSPGVNGDGVWQAAEAAAATASEGR
ncbi:unnamed protein product, partial [Laminaria digitata]